MQILENLTQSFVQPQAKTELNIQQMKSPVYETFNDIFQVKQGEANHKNLRYLIPTENSLSKDYGVSMIPGNK